MMTKKEDKAIVTDPHDLVDRTVEMKMKPFMTAFFEGQERVYQKMDRLEKVMCRRQANVHSALNSIAIGFLTIFMLLLLTGC